MYEDVVSRVASPSLSVAVRDELIRLITNGALPPGTRLNEVQLAQRLGVSRGPLREAARELEGLGLTVSRPRQGFYVADFSEDDIVAIYEVSSWINQAVIHDFLTYCPPQKRRDILADLNLVSLTSPPIFAQSLLQFRQRATQLLHNRYLAEQALALYRRFYIISALVAAEDTPERIAHIFDTQQRFWGAIAKGDRAQAEDISRADIQHWLHDVPPRFLRPQNQATD